MDMLYKLFATQATAVVLLCGCQTPGAQANSAALEKPAVDPRIGVEADRICFARSINGWKTIDGDDDAIILRTGVSNEYRVAFSGSCRGSDFDFAETIGIENRPAGGCVRKGDVLLVNSAGDYVNRCFITGINEWNADAAAESEE